MKQNDIFEKQIKNYRIKPSPDFKNRVLEQAQKAFPQNRFYNPGEYLKGLLMNRKFLKLSIAATILIVAILSLTVFNSTIPVASAAEIFYQAAQQLSPENITSIRIKAQIRSEPSSDQSSIDLEHDFVPFVITKKIDGDPDNFESLKWRIDKGNGGRIISMNGQKTVIYIPSQNFSFSCRPLVIAPNDSSRWIGLIANPQRLLKEEYSRALQGEDENYKIYTDIVNGLETLVVESFQPSEVSSKDIWYNDSITNIDRTKVYYLNPESKILEGFKMIGHTDTEDIVIIEVLEIDYAPIIADSEFDVELPDDVVYTLPPEELVLPDNERYVAMGPVEAAETFLNALADEDWEEVVKFVDWSHLKDSFKKRNGGIEVISIGTPYHPEKIDFVWVVPYEIKRRLDNEPRKGQIYLKSEGPGGRLMFCGGL